MPMAQSVFSTSLGLLLQNSLRDMTPNRFMAIVTVMFMHSKE
jgi:hypothetical protein